MELRPHTEDFCDMVASLETWFRAATFCVLLHEACVLFLNLGEFRGETSFAYRSSVLKVEICTGFFGVFIGNLG